MNVLMSVSMVKCELNYYDKYDGSISAQLNNWRQPKTKSALRCVFYKTKHAPSYHLITTVLGCRQRICQRQSMLVLELLSGCQTGANTEVCWCNLLQNDAKQELQWAGVIVQPLAAKKRPTCASVAQGKCKTAGWVKRHHHMAWTA